MVFLLEQLDLRFHIADDHNCSDIDFIYHFKPRPTCINSLQPCSKRTPYLGTCISISFLILFDHHCKTNMKLHQATKHVNYKTKVLKL